MGDETSNNSKVSRKKDNSGIQAINQEIQRIEEESQRDEIKAIGEDCQQIEVLIVNDEPMNILILETMFESLGCEVSKAFNGFEAAQMAKDHQYDLIMMDLEMPVCNGFEASLKIKKLPN